MKLLHLRARGFKRFRDFELDLDHDRILVIGENEAGKSTLVEALLAGLYGLAPQRRGGGHTGALRDIAPWDGGPAAVGLTFRLDKGRVLEADWDFTSERTQVIDRGSGEDISSGLPGGTHGWVDAGGALIGIPATVFTQVTCVGEGQLAKMHDNAEVRASLLRLAESGSDVLVEQALNRLDEGVRQATIPRTTAATRRNQLAREVAPLEADLAAARRAREALEGEVQAIAATEAALDDARRSFADASAEDQRRQVERLRLRTEIDRASGRLAEAELRLAALEPDAPVHDALEPRAWSSDEIEAARQLLAAPMEGIGRGGGVPWVGIGFAVLGGLILTIGLLSRAVVLEATGLFIIAVGVYALAQPQVVVHPPLRVGTMTFPDRRALMTALDHQRARGEYEGQRGVVDKLHGELQGLAIERPPGSASSGAPPSEAQLQQQLVSATEAQTELALQLERQRASLVRGAQEIPEVAPLEERLAEAQDKINRLDAFGAACERAATILRATSQEVRRAYAPRLQKYLSKGIAQVTSGRYRDAIVSDNFDVMLRAPETRSMVELRQLSRGTQQQVYLLLRLALLEAMGQKSERLPLLLDDALALSDDPRRAELLNVLLREERQVVYLTPSEREAGEWFGPEWHRVLLPAPRETRSPVADAERSENQDVRAREAGLVGVAEDGPDGAGGGAQ
jgi:uncharacterized protein YhaN